MQKQKVKPGAPGGGGPGEKEKFIFVTYGVHTNIKIAGADKTVAQVRELLAPILNIDSEAVAYVNGKEVEDEESRVLEGGELLEFLKQLGKKGEGILNF